MKRYGAEGLLGWGAGFGTLREIAPLLTALMISGRVGANNTAELGTMVVTEQIDALRVLAIDPISFLIAPRFIAIVSTLFMLTLFADALALLGAAYTGRRSSASSPHDLLQRPHQRACSASATCANGLVKSVVFGLVMALASCHFGLATKGGAPGVGRAVNATVVASAAGIFVLDYLVTSRSAADMSDASTARAAPSSRIDEEAVPRRQLGAVGRARRRGDRSRSSAAASSTRSSSARSTTARRGRREQGARRSSRCTRSATARSFFSASAMGFIGMILVYQAGLQAKRVVPDCTLLGATYLELLVRDLRRLDRRADARHARRRRHRRRDRLDGRHRAGRRAAHVRRRSRSTT